jgi:hypothetical protein
MIHIVGTVKGTAAIAGKLFFTGIIGVIIGEAAADVSRVIGEQTPIALASVVALGMMIWNLSGTLRGLRDEVVTSNRRLDKIELVIKETIAHDASIHQRVRYIEKLMKVKAVLHEEETTK